MPKPLVEIAGRPMICWALDGLPDAARTVVVALREHEERHRFTERVREACARDVEVVLIPDVTEGQLCTVLEARDLIATDEPLLVASCDTVVRSALGEDIAARAASVAGLISVARLPGDAWSFARVGEDGRVVEVAEKVRISDLASTGLYFFSRGSEFVRHADAQVAAGERARGEFFVIPVYRRFIEAGERIEVSMADEVWDLGTPEGARAFERHLNGAA